MLLVRVVDVWRRRVVQAMPPGVEGDPVRVSVLVAWCAGFADFDVVDGVNFPVG